MKTKMIITAAVALLFTACTKQGATGPQGPTGNANVQMTSYTANFSKVNSVYNATVSIPSVNYATDVVMVYILTASSGTALPVSNYYSSGDEFNYTVVSGAVDINYYEGSTNHIEGSDVFNIAVIPVQAIKAHPGTNWNNLNEVLQLPGIKTTQIRG
jgi:hypothetical protein